MSEPSHGDSHATDAHKAAAETYKAAMAAEGAAFERAIDALREEHDAKVAQIQSDYTDALADEGSNEAA